MSSDPRVLQLEGETVYTSARCRSPRYHRPGCDDLELMEGDPVARDVAVAKWKGYDPCSHCFDVDTSEGDCLLTGEDVDRIRRSLTCGATCGELAERYGVSETTVSDHAKRRLEFTYEQEPAVPPVEYDGGWTTRSQR